MIRVLQIIDNMDIGGMESMLMNYYRNIDRNKVQFDFLISDKGECFYENEIRQMGGCVFKVTPRRKNPIANRKEMIKFFNLHKYEIVEIHQGVTYLLPLRLAKRNNINNIIIHSHGVDEKYKRGIYDIFRRKVVIPYIAKTATEFFACSKLVLSDLFNEDILKRKRYTIINNAIDVKKYAYNIAIRKKIRKQLAVGDGLVVGHVGRFHRQKNQEFIIELAKKMPECVFVLVGDGESMDEYKKKELKNVIFCGQCDNVNEIMQAFDIFILPSRWEGLPLVAIEAQAAGLPILLSDAVSREAKITENVRFLPLQLERWMEAINDFKHYNRKENSEIIKKNGYDCKKEAAVLEKKYKDMINRKIIK